MGKQVARILRATGGADVGRALLIFYTQTTVHLRNVPW